MDFRLYDGALGRFAGIDILADLYQSHSPYHFGYNNPISFADPTGLYSNPRPGNNLEILDNGDVALFYTNEDGDLAAIFFINRTRESQPNEIKEFGINLSQYGGGGGGSQSGAPGGYGGGYGGSGNSGPREASNGNLGEVNQDLGAFCLANGIKTELIDIAAKSGAITQTTKNYVNTFKGLGKGLGVASAGISVYGGVNIMLMEVKVRT